MRPAVGNRPRADPTVTTGGLAWDAVGGFAWAETAVALHGRLEGGRHQVSTLGVVDAMTHHEPGVVVDDDEREGVRAVDVAVYEVDVP